MRKLRTSSAALVVMLSLIGCDSSQDVIGHRDEKLSYGALAGLLWTQQPGTAKEIAAGNNGRIWKIAAGSGDQDIAYLDLSATSPTWMPAVQPKKGIRIEVEYDGTVWVVNSLGEAWHGDANGANWTKMNQSVNGTIPIIDIGQGFGYVWAVGGTTDQATGYEVFTLVRWNDGSQSWVSQGIRAMRVTADETGYAWVVDMQGRVFHLERYPHKFTAHWVQKGTTPGYNIGAGQDGQVWMTGPAGTGRIYKWTGSAWDLCDNGLGVEIDRGNGFTLVVNTQGQIWKGTP